ncbi:hypothetical protein VNO77_12984 [Canavalia gladiata]|uniref:Uncharacterized protein n=1 Tax=Canavalia gladiata TaxID=3824 RepID=A0AAN9M0H5_CANGL
MYLILSCLGKINNIALNGQWFVLNSEDKIYCNKECVVKLSFSCILVVLYKLGGALDPLTIVWLWILSGDKFWDHKRT